MGEQLHWHWQPLILLLVHHTAGRVPDLGCRDGHVQHRHGY